MQDEHMGSLKAARLRFSRFFFRFRDGESAADVYDRMTTFRETLRNDMNFGRFGTKQDERATTVIIVSHGLTVRVFLMRWFKWTVEMFEQVRNLHNAGLLVLDRGRGGRYSLVKYHGVRELRTMGFTDEMIEDQNWQWNSSTEELNSDWPTSGSDPRAQRSNSLQLWTRDSMYPCSGGEALCVAPIGPANASFCNAIHNYTGVNGTCGLYCF